MTIPSRFSRRRFGHLLGSCGVALWCGARPGGLLARTPRRALVTTAPEAQSLKMRTGRVIEILEQHTRTGYLTGAVALVGRGARAEVVAVGDRSREAPGVMQRDSLFRITSMTTPITATATLMLVD